MDIVMEQQQLDPKLANTTLWLNQEEEEEEEVGVDLLARRSSSRIPPNGDGATATGADGELQPAPAPEMEENEDAPVTAYGGENGEVDQVVNGEGGGNSVYFDKLQGTESINETNGMQSEITKVPSMDIDNQTVKVSEDKEDFGLSPAPVEHLHEAEGNFKHFENGTKVEANVDLIEVIEEFEEDLVDLHVERVLEKQNTHDLYCPNCKSCITKKVILIRRRPKVSTRYRPKRGSKVDPIPDSADFGGSDDTPEIHSDDSPVAAPAEQNEEQKQEAISCLSCFSLFVPTGNGCFKFFKFFRWGRQTEHAQSAQEIRQTENIQRPAETRQREHTESSSAQGTKLSENTQTPQGINPSNNTQSPQVVRPEGNAKTPEQISHHEDTKSPQKISHDVDISSPQHINLNGDAQGTRDINWNEDAQSPQKISPDANMSSPQHIKHNEDAQKAQPISWNEDKQSPQKISRDENARSPQDINQNNIKQRPQKITTARTNWFFSIFASKSKETAGKEYSPVQVGHAISVQSAVVTTAALIDKGYIDGAAIKPILPGIGEIFPSTHSSLLDKLTGDSTEQKPDVGTLQGIVGDNEIKDIETGLLEPTLQPGTDVAPLSQRATETERRGSDAGEVHEWEILKSIVYGGLIESITSLGVVSSAAGAGADTLNVLALGVANLIGGLIIIFHNLRELRNDQPRVGVEEDRYQVLLGRRQNFVMHVIVAVLSFLVFGLVPPVVYGFSFRKSDDKDLKLSAVAGASLICIFLLALGKGHVRRPHRTYFRSVSYYISLGITVSGISYVVGQLIKRLLEQLGLFESSSTVSLPFLETVSMEVGRATY
ncbi:hypothetical protein HRI_004301600 [Hibiscus trionum]|uniref:Membrane protein of ER body-like protein n=1 Tax=Hibiscus trionum TaxID=183268 RepID=A0A9W7MNX9_HIBTR|nr:hypothetical protein HRI_004301600 [Hibiscus trionum]